jgi:hypothetical protein
MRRAVLLAATMALIAFVSSGARRMQLDTLRLLLIKVGGRVRELLTKVRMHLASGHSDKARGTLSHWLSEAFVNNPG